MEVPSALHNVLQRRATVFNDELGEVKGATAKIHVDPQAAPRFCKPRTVPYALRGRVEQELDRLEKDGIIQPVLRVGSPQLSQKPLHPLTCRNCVHSLAWLTTMPSFSHTSPVCWPLCTGCSKRMRGGHGAQKKTELSRLQRPV